MNFDKFKIKYELCEIILCSVSEQLRETGLTVMDGPFFSIMPFGKTGFHSLTSVMTTPHEVCYESLPYFECQKSAGGLCNEKFLGNCNQCAARPESAYEYMNHLAEKYIKEEYAWKYERSLFSMKPILLSSEMDDSRPTVIKIHEENPTFLSVLSGKINTVYDLDRYLEE